MSTLIHLKMCQDRTFAVKRVLRFNAQTCGKNGKPIFIIHSPGDEEPFGGCVSAGRGFVHVNAFGDLTPCPVSSVSTHNLKHATLKEALNGELFKEIRENKLLEDRDGPCSLVFHQEELRQIVQRLKA